MKIFFDTVSEQHTTWGEAAVYYTPAEPHKCLGPLEFKNGRPLTFDAFVLPDAENFPWELCPDIPMQMAYQVERLNWGKAVEAHRVFFDAETGDEVMRQRFNMGGDLLCVHLQTFEGERVFKYFSKPGYQRYFDATPVHYDEPPAVQGSLF